MRKLILSEWISLDGYVSDKQGQLGFFGPFVRATYAEAGQVKLLKNIDTILLGRTSYQQFASVWSGRPAEEEALAKTMNTIKKMVFTNTLTAAPWGEWPAAEIATGDAAATIQQLKALPGNDMIVWASITLAHALIKENMVDEYHLYLCPALTGGGVKLFKEDIMPAILKLIESATYNSGVVFLRYTA